MGPDREGIKRYSARLVAWRPSQFAARERRTHKGLAGVHCDLPQPFSQRSLAGRFTGGTQPLQLVFCDLKPSELIQQLKLAGLLPSRHVQVCNTALERAQFSCNRDNPVGILRVTRMTLYAAERLAYNLA